MDTRESDTRTTVPGRSDAAVDRSRDLNPDHPDANRDPITGAPGSHPVGAGVGAAGGTAAGVAAGAAIGSVVPGVGTIAGGVVGGIVGGIGGGYAGKGVAEAINPTDEEAYWRDEHVNRPYYEAGSTYEMYAPAYRYGWEARSQYADKDYETVEADLERDWETRRGNSSLGWDKAKHAARDAWDRVTNRK